MREKLKSVGRGKLDGSINETASGHIYDVILEQAQIQRQTKFSENSIRIVHKQNRGIVNTCERTNGSILDSAHRKKKNKKRINLSALMSNYNSVSLFSSTINTFCMASNRRALVRHHPRINHRGKTPGSTKTPISTKRHGNDIPLNEWRIQIRIQCFNEQMKRNNSFYATRFARERDARYTVACNSSNKIKWEQLAKRIHSRVRPECIRRNWQLLERREFHEPKKWLSNCCVKGWIASNARARNENRQVASNSF